MPVATRYPREQMHRIKYTKLTPEQILGPECTVVEMAKAQGEGVVRWSESVVLENSYIRRTGGWKILRSTRRAG